ncbi:ribosomal protein S5 domain 2-type protein [Melanogaster broomeanus]|nr:ribosomal protein S5 domain 2-type protein [Melanogaster broomeanus]
MFSCYFLRRSHWHCQSALRFLHIARSVHHLPNPSWPHELAASSSLSSHASKFLAYASTLPHPAHLPNFLTYLKALPSHKRATHFMYAYRTASGSAAHDGGERGAGERLERLLELRDVKNVVVVVVRWYGGVKIGSERWKCISEVAKQALDHWQLQRDSSSPSPKGRK